APFAEMVDAEPGQVDRWLLGELDLLVGRATEAMDSFQFDEALKAIRAFAWEVLADNYIELVKARLYGPDAPERRAAQRTLFIALETLCRLLAPFTPFLSEEIYHSLTGESVHRQRWPEASGTPIDPAGLAIKEIAAALRRYKAERGLALNAPLPGITVYSDLGIETTDLQGVANSRVESRRGRPQIEAVPIAVNPQMRVIGPIFKDRSRRVIEALRSMDPATVSAQRASGGIRVDIGGEALEVPPEAVEVVVENRSAGLAVDLLQVGAATVMVRR
ncbi:MAG: class I tRNA ligase family protein, partial [Methanothrix sp.]|nr:class I tRNA ligase family protein [Methanothrix sp.]